MAEKWQAKVVLPPHVVLGPGLRRIHALLEVSNADEGDDLAVPLNVTFEDSPAFARDEGFRLPPAAEEAAREAWSGFLTADDGLERKKLHLLRKSR
jgi:hypothetical protein